MRIVVALGGNALLQRGETLSYENQKSNIKKAVQSLKTIAEKHELLLVHGNGPQVGLIALQNEAYKEVEPYPFDALGAETQGMIGYMIAHELDQVAPSKKTVAMMTRILVDENDTAFKNPNKFIGPVYDKEKAEKLALERKWVVKEDTKGYRRVVASPAPKKIIELEAIASLLSKGFNVICCGGGGIPIAESGSALKGVEAVVDKDRTACLLAKEINADAFVILSDVECIYENFGKETQKGVHFAPVDYLEKQDFAAGSMGPKVESVVNYVKNSNGFAAIGSLDKLESVVEKLSGTIIQKEAALSYYKR